MTTTVEKGRRTMMDTIHEATMRGARMPSSASPFCAARTAT
jgi:hypothetical protein